MQLAEFNITKEFFEEDKRINVYVYPYGKRISINFYISNFNLYFFHMAPPILYNSISSSKVIY